MKEWKYGLSVNVLKFIVIWFWIFKILLMNVWDCKGFCLGVFGNCIVDIECCFFIMGDCGIFFVMEGDCGIYIGVLCLFGLFLFLYCL